MRGPIDYIIVHFEGNNFKGEVLDALTKQVDNGVIDVLDLAVITKDEAGNINSVELENVSGEIAKKAFESKKNTIGIITEEDITEVGDLIENNNAVGLLIIEQLWAKELKQALLNANATLIGEGRIHPEAAQELED